MWSPPPESRVSGARGRTSRWGPCSVRVCHPVPLHIGRHPRAARRPLLLPHRRLQSSGVTQRRATAPSPERSPAALWSPWKTCPGSLCAARGPFQTGHAPSPGLGGAKAQSPAQQRGGVSGAEEQEALAPFKRQALVHVVTAWGRCPVTYRIQNRPPPPVHASWLTGRATPQPPRLRRL